jgi:hypothetical protein
MNAPMNMFDSWIDDYLGSGDFLFLDPALKEPAEGILRAFVLAAAARGATSHESLVPATVEAVLLRDMGNLALPFAVRRGVPDILEGFFAYLGESGRWPAAASWRVVAEALADKYRAALREDGGPKGSATGGIKGETFRKSSTETGRNEPCFCGSGRKFKKCCGPLMGE